MALTWLLFEPIVPFPELRSVPFNAFFLTLKASSCKPTHVFSRKEKHIVALWVHTEMNMGLVWMQMRLCGRTSPPVVFSHAFLVQLLGPFKL